MQKQDTTQTAIIDGEKYRIHFNDDPDCPVSLSRIYRTGERRIIQSGTHKITQVKKADGSWWNIDIN